MANRLNGNVIIVDSGMGNVPILGATSNLTSFDIASISFLSLGTNAAVTITNSNTSLDIVYTANQLTIGTLSNAGAVVNNPQWQSFPGGFRTGALKVPTLTAGTAFIYLR